MSKKKNKSSRSKYDSSSVENKIKNRKTGIDIMGAVPWGTHLCQFYQTKDDLIDILVPYFKAGLENNEFCMWITSEPLHVDEAKKALKKVLQNLDEYIKKGQIEILDSSEWYTKSGKFDADEVLKGWISKEKQALEKGFDGLRLTGNTFWLEKKDWEDFTKYEEVINNVIGRHHMIAICSYSLDKCNASEIIDVISNHQFSLIKRKGKWQRIESSERKKAKEEVLRAKNEWELTFNSLPDLIAIIDKQHRIIRANKTMAQYLGIPAEQCINLNCYSCVHKSGKPPEFCPHTQTLKDGKEHVAELYEEKLGGYFLITTTPLIDKNGKLIGSVHVARDITDRKRAEEALQESENRLNKAEEIAHLGSWELNLKSNTLIWSDEVYRIFGLQPKEFDSTYEAFLEAVYPEDRAAVDAAYSNSISKGQDSYEIEHRILRKNGEIRFVYEKCNHIRDESGKVIRSIGMVHDITERKLFDAKIRYLASFPQLNPSPVLEVNQKGEIIYQNPATQKLFPGSNKLSSNHPLLSDWKQVVNKLKANNWSKNIIREISFDQSYYQQIISPYEKNKIRLYNIDVTERKKMEEALRESEIKYRNIVENTTDLIMVTQPDGIISYLSPTCKEILGYNPEELIGKNPNIFHPDDIKNVQQNLSRALKGEKGYDFEYRILTKQVKIKWVSHSWSPVFINDKLQSIVSVVEDITKRKEIENNIKELNRNLMHQTIDLEEANKELEAFSYSVSHDLRAPLRSIDGFSQALLEDYTDVLDKQGKDYLQRLQKASQHMGQLIDDMLKLSRLTRAEKNIKKVNLSEMAETIMDRLTEKDRLRKIDFVKQDNLIAEGDPNLLNILLENLLGNAYKFTKKCKRARIELGKKHQNNDTVFFIKDNGAGFNMKYANKLFIPFQRLHDNVDYPGTGIGLGIVSRIIHRHGGRIWAEAEENKGATFYFTLGGKN
jgi:PAS domain S-box-containing protein